MNPVSPEQVRSAPLRKRADLDSPLANAGGELSRPKVLLLEDDEPFSNFVQSFLQKQGFDVVVVVNGVDGVHQILAQDFDAILCDLVLPTLPGDMFYRAVERMRPHLCNRFVFMTGNYDQPKVKEFIAMGGGMLLIKPFHIDELREMLAFVELRNLHLAN